jgi:hypothetical protein
MTRSRERSNRSRSPCLLKDLRGLPTIPLRFTKPQSGGSIIASTGKTNCAQTSSGSDPAVCALAHFVSSLNRPTSLVNFLMIQ